MEIFKKSFYNYFKGSLRYESHKEASRYSNPPKYIDTPTSLQEAVHLLMQRNCVKEYYGFEYDAFCDFVFWDADTLDMCVDRASQTIKNAMYIAKLKVEILEFDCFGIRIPETNLLFLDGRIVDVNFSDIKTLWLEEWQPIDSLDAAIAAAKERSRAFADSLGDLHTEQDLVDEFFHPLLPKPYSRLEEGNYTRVTTGGNIFIFEKSGKYRLGALFTRKDKPSHLIGTIYPKRLFLKSFKDLNLIK